jgi:lipoyl(octanoyl) transferase
VTGHGFAFNVNTNMEHFNLIVPCGCADHGVTSLERLTGGRVPLDQVEHALARHFGEVFERELLIVSGAASG